MIVLFDMDGVLVDFVGGVEDVFGPVPLETKRNREIHEWYNMSPKRFWQFLGTKRFWAELKEIPVGMRLLRETVDLVGSNNVFICSSPSTSSDSLAGKYQWLQARFGGHTMREFIFTPHKYLLARPDRVLIDDFDTNTDTFIKHGGWAITFPQPWNSLISIADEDTFVKECISQLKGIKRIEHERTT